MDPLTLALIVGGLFAATRIKRASTPAPPQVNAPAPPFPSLGGIPPHAFAGGLRPPVTHRAIGTERLAEGTRESEATEPEKEREIKVTLGTSKAQQAMASAAAADVVGAAPRAPGASPPIGGSTYVGASHPSTYPSFGLVQGPGGPTTRYR